MVWKMASSNVTYTLLLELMCYRVKKKLILILAKIFYGAAPNVTIQAKPNVEYKTKLTFTFDIWYVFCLFSHRILLHLVDFTFRAY